MDSLSRRSLLAGAAALLAPPLIPEAASETAAAHLRTLLDSAAHDRTAALAALRKIDAASLPASPRLDLLTARAGLAIDIELARRFPFGRLGKSPYLVTTGNGAWLRADATAETIRRETAALRSDAAHGVRLPRGLIEPTIAAMESARNSAAGPRAEALAEQEALLRTLAADAPPPGMAALPDGDDYYRLLLRRFAGDDADPGALRQRLERELARTLARADALFQQIGRHSGSVGARYTALWHDPDGLYPDDDAGRDRAIADMNLLLEAARARLPGAFGPLPPSVSSVHVQRMSRTEEAAGRQGYRQLPEGSRPGSYVVDLNDIRRRPRWTLPAVVHHELLPGHMVQLPIEAAASPHPLRIEYAAAFAEGWAIYAEQLAAAEGAYRGDALGELGLCHWRLFRITRALADLGIHLDGWSHAQALGKLQAWMGEPAYFAPFVTDLNRIVLEPALRAAEAMAWLAIEDLSRGRPAIPFHHRLLAHGRMRTDQFRATVESAR